MPGANRITTLGTHVCAVFGAAGLHYMVPSTWFLLVNLKAGYRISLDRRNCLSQWRCEEGANLGPVISKHSKER